MYLLAPKMYILTPKMYILAPKMEKGYLSKRYSPSDSSCTFFFRECKVSSVNNFS